MLFNRSQQLTVSKGPRPSAFTISIDHLLVRDARYRLDEHWEDMTSGFIGRTSNLVGTKGVLYFWCFGSQKCSVQQYSEGSMEILNIAGAIITVLMGCLGLFFPNAQQRSQA